MKTSGTLTEPGPQWGMRQLRWRKGCVGQACGGDSVKRQDLGWRHHLSFSIYAAFYFVSDKILPRICPWSHTEFELWAFRGIPEGSADEAKNAQLWVLHKAELGKAALAGQRT